jgi:hypothetical protein
MTRGTLLTVAVTAAVIAVTGRIEIPFRSCEVTCPWDEFARHFAAGSGIALVAVTIALLADRYGHRWSRPWAVQIASTLALFSWSVWFLLRPFGYD